MKKQEKIFEKARAKPPRERRTVGLWLSAPVFDAFEKLCKQKKTTPSRTVETFMREALGESGK